MEGQPRITEVLTELSWLVLSDRPLDAVLRHVVRLAVETITTCDSCGISVVEGARVSTRAASDRRADEVDNLQYRAGEGPCLAAIATGDPIVVPDFSVERRWPAFRRLVQGSDVAASYSVPLKAGQVRLGSLNYYSVADRFGPEDRAIGDVVARQASVALANAQTLAGRHAELEQLHEALASRDVIGQAKGRLMARYDIDADSAFDRLRALSQNHNVKLRDVAARVARGEELDTGPGHDRRDEEGPGR
jgi:GAF domain-containing protein